MKRLRKTQITVWPAITDLMTTVVIIAVLGGIIGYQHNKRLLEIDRARISIMDEFESQLSSSNINVKVMYDEGVLRFSENAINFPFGSETPSPRHLRNIERLAQVLNEVVPCYITPDISSMRIRNNNSSSNSTYCQSPTKYICKENNYQWSIGTILIEGHTDNVPVGENHRLKNNLELSSVRSANVYNMITACKPSIQDMRNSKNVPIFSTSGYGEMRPADTSDLSSIDNRRIDIRLILEPRQDKAS